MFWTSLVEPAQASSEPLQYLTDEQEMAILVARLAGDSSPADIAFVNNCSPADVLCTIVRVSKAVVGHRHQREGFGQEQVAFAMLSIISGDALEDVAKSLDMSADELKAEFALTGHPAEFLVWANVSY